MKKTKLLLVAIAMMASYSLSAQMAVTTDGSSADASAMLEVKSTNKGLLIPNVTLTGTTDGTTITTPAVSLLVYNTATISDVTPGYYYNSGSTGSPVWARLANTTALAIGDSYQGGKIFWLDATGQHGLIAATADQNTGIQWDNDLEARFIGASGDGLYAGEMNTAMIISTQMASNQFEEFAAKVCADYSVTDDGVTYGDWYLPSKYELDLLYQQKTTVGGFDNSLYWSSTEKPPSSSWDQDFTTGTQSYSSQNELYRVRAVRAF